MKKIILLLIVFIAFAFSFTAKAQCIATTEFPEDATTSNNHGLQEIEDCIIAGEFSALTGLTIGQNYQTGAYFVKVTINDKTETIRIIKN